MKPAFLLFLTLLISGCSAVSSNTAKTDNKAVSTPSSAAAPTSTNGVSPVPTAPAPGLTPPPPGSAPVVPGQPAQNGSTNENSSALGRRPVKGTEQSGPAPPPPFRKAPDGSQISTFMNKDGLPVEVRIFKGALPFTRVEALWLDPANKEVKFTLRNRKLVTLRTDKLASLSTASVAQLIELSRAAK